MQKINQFKCHKCGKSFKSNQILLGHLNKKIPCDRVLRCDKCGKIFKHKGNLKRHINRKTPCDPIQGNPLDPMTDPLKCHFCYKKYQYKSTLERHLKTCKIKNGNMDILYQKLGKVKKG